jgi:CubicO group peptidase (beta-lactamase class C family)
LSGLLLLSNAPADPIDNYLKAQMSANHIPGLAIAIVKDGQVRKLRCYGVANLEWSANVTSNTRFQLASTTKALTGSLLMTLVQEGKISLDDPVTKYLAEAPASWSGIKIRNLATHSSGVPDLGPAGKDIASAKEGVEVVCKLPLNFAPGEKSGYGSADFLVLTAILERITGKSLQALFRERLFTPLMMSYSEFDEAVETGLTRRSEVLSHRSSVYLWDTDRQKAYSFLFPVNSYSAGGLFSSVSDLARWASALDKGNILNQKAKDTMWESHKLNDGQDSQWGIGWVVRTYNGEKTVGHSGGPALSDVLRFVDRNLTIIVLQNQERMYPYLAQGVADLYLNRPTAPLPKPITDPNPSTTQNIRRMLLSLAKGNLDASFFARDHEDLFEDVRNLLGPYVRSMAPLGKFELIKIDPDKNFTEYTYSALYGKKLVRWIFDLDASGKILGISPTTP